MMPESAVLPNCIREWVISFSSHSNLSMSAKLLHLGPTLCDPMNCSLPGSFVHGILQARTLEWVAMPSSRDLLDLGIEPASLNSSWIDRSALTTSTTLLLLLSCSVVSDFATPGLHAAHQASLSFTVSWSLLRLMSTESMMLSNHFILCQLSSPHVLNLSQHQDLFQWVSSLHQVAKALELQFQHQCFHWIFWVDFL